MKPTTHLAASVAVSGSIYLYTRSAVVSVVSFVCGFLIDVDHFLDYILEYGFRVNLKKFLRVFYETRFNRLFLVFHAWELIIGLFVVSWLSAWNEVILGLFIGFFQHMLLDQMANGVTAGGYFFVYRLVKRFAVHAILREAEIKKKRIRTNT